MGFQLFVIISSLLLVAYLIFQEVSRKNKHWLKWRVVASLLLVSCFVFLIIDLSYPTHQVQQTTALRLITHGTPIDTLKTNGLNYYTDLSLAQELKQKGIYIPDLAYYLADHPQIQTVKVYGYGLEEENWRKLKDHEVQFYPAPPPDGLIECNWNGQLKVGETLTVQGSYQHNFNSPVNLKLMGFGTVLDSVQLPTKKLNTFTLQHAIRQKGKAVLTLLAIHKNDTLFKEKIPVQSFESPALKLLMLTSFPGFEYNFIKKWLYEQQYSLALRTQISKNKYSSDFLNRSTFPFARLRAEMLAKEAVLLLDQQAFEQLSAPDKNAIEQAVANGLGLVIWADQPTLNIPLLSKLKLSELPKQEKLIEFTTAHQKALTPLPSNAQMRIDIMAGQKALISSKQGDIIASETLYGSGKIIVTTLQNSYQWLLSGHPQDYGQYWTQLINAAARKQTPALTVQTNQSIPLIQHKLTFYISSDHPTTPLINYQGKTLTAKQHLFSANSWEVQDWPRHRGWNTISIDQQDKQFFVFGQEDWKHLRDTELLRQNSKHASMQKTKQNSVSTTTVFQKHALSKWWFFVGFILSLSFLWFENRFYHKN